MKNAPFWNVAPCKSCVNRRFGGTSVHTRSTWRHIPEDGILFTGMSINSPEIEHCVFVQLNGI
jgi:hypothetical protein